MAMTYPLSQGHVDSGNKKPTVIRPFGDNVAGWPDGFMFSTVNDLARFAIAFMGSNKHRDVLKSSMTRKLSTPYVEIHSPFGFGNGRYGYGLFVHDYRGVRVVWHAGLIPGFGALLQMVPAQHVAVIVLANKSGALLNKTAEKAMELMLPLNDKTSSEPKEPRAISSKEISEYVGTYTNNPERAEIVVKEHKLVLKLRDGEFPITKIGDYRFSIKRANESKAQEFVLVTAADGTVEYLHMERHALKKERSNK
jgi:CubicO group peptidase (beta-lactamase class C family)